MRRSGFLALLLITAIVGGAWPALAIAGPPALWRDVQAAMDRLGSVGAPPASISDYIQPDTQIEPSIAVNPANPLNVVAAYQEGRIDSGGDATNGFATSFDGGRTWTYGELPKLTSYPGQGGAFGRASDAVVAFGPNNTVYANSLVFDNPGIGAARSGITVNVSKDGGRTWSDPVTFQDDKLGGTNDKNWIVVDNSEGAGHHRGRVYVVWDRIAPVVYDYCDHDCDQKSNWLPNLQTIPGLVYPGQGIGAYPVVMPNGGLGMVMETLTTGVPTSLQPTDQPEVAGANQVFFSAPAAGTTPYPAPLVWTPPIYIAKNGSKGVPAQRASDGLPAATVDDKNGVIYAVWDDGRFRTDGTNDVVLTKSTDNGATWSAPVRVNPGPTTDHVDHYNAGVAVGSDGSVHVAYRRRLETPPSSATFSPEIDSYYQESRDGGATFSAPLKINAQPSLAYYDAFSRGGSFEGDYDQVASSGGYTYFVREQGQKLSPLEPPGLVPDGTGMAFSEAGKGHQHQRTWVALVRDETPPPGAAGQGGGKVTRPVVGLQVALAAGAIKRAALARRGLAVRITSNAALTGTLTLSLATKAKKNRRTKGKVKAGRTLGVAKVALRGPGTLPLKVRVTRRARTILARARRGGTLVLTLQVRDPSGAPASVVRRVKLRR